MPPAAFKPMQRKTLKRNVKEVAIDYDAPGLPASVSRLRPTLYQEGQGYMAWYEGDGKKYYGFGKSAEDALRGFDRYYQEKQPKPVRVAEPAQATEEPVVKYLHEHLAPLQRLLKRNDAA